MFVAATVVVGATATKLIGAGVLITGGQMIKIKNTHATDKLIVGGSNVAANNGYGIDAGQTLDLGNLDVGDVVYAIRGGSADISAQVLVKG
jgi:hypothetical protein